MADRKTTGKRKEKGKRKKRIYGLALCKDQALRIAVARMGGLAPHSKPHGLLAVKLKDPAKLKHIATIGGYASAKVQAERKKKQAQLLASKQPIEIDKSQA
jgi:hypothetical protein